MASLNEIERFPNSTFQDPFCIGSRPSKAFQITMFCVIMFFSLIGNTLIVAVFYKNKTLRTPVHYFIVNMAISDLMIPLIHLPWLISHAYNDGVWLVDGVFGNIICKFVGIAWGVSAFVSIVNMVAIAIERFHAVLFYLRPALISRKSCYQIIVVTWVMAIIFRAHFLYAVRIVQVDNKLTCNFHWEPPSYRLEVLKLTWITYLGLSFLSAIALTVLYSSIIIFLYRQKNNLNLASEVIKRRAKSNRNIALMLVIVVVVFYALWIPHHCERIIYYLKPNIRVPCFLIWFGNFVLALCYPIVNPVVYYLFNETYHQGMRELLCCPWPCTNPCNDWSHSPVQPQGEDNAANAEQVNNPNENIELQEHE